MHGLIVQCYPVVCLSVWQDPHPLKHVLSGKLTQKQIFFKQKWVFFTPISLLLIFAFPDVSCHLDCSLFHLHKLSTELRVRQGATTKHSSFFFYPRFFLPVHSFLPPCLFSLYPFSLSLCSPFLTPYCLSLTLSLHFPKLSLSLCPSVTVLHQCHLILNWLILSSSFPPYLPPSLPIILSPKLSIFLFVLRSLTFISAT